MPIYKPTAITAKLGLNFVRNAVEEGGSLFIKCWGSWMLPIGSKIVPMRLSPAFSAQSWSSDDREDGTSATLG